MGSALSFEPIRLLWTMSCLVSSSDLLYRGVSGLDSMRFVHEGLPLATQEAFAAIIETLTMAHFFTATRHWGTDDANEDEVPCSTHLSLASLELFRELLPTHADRASGLWWLSSGIVPTCCTV